MLLVVYVSFPSDDVYSVILYHDKTGQGRLGELARVTFAFQTLWSLLRKCSLRVARVRVSAPLADVQVLAKQACAL